jgi:phosphoribosyl-dephospho-CoA transferase
MERMNSRILAPTHELIRLRNPADLWEDAPAWVEVALRRAPWVVVRRGYLSGGMLPVGIRGTARHDRHAVWLALEEIAEQLSPEDLISSRELIERTGRKEAAAFDALARVAPVLERRGIRWGPGGSVGFEIATGVATVTPSSDLDLILRADRPFDAGDSMDLLSTLTAASAPVRADVIVETPSGGVSLAELAAMPTTVLVRTSDGARLSVDPWKIGTDASLEVMS